MLKASHNTPVRRPSSMPDSVYTTSELPTDPYDPLVRAPQEPSPSQESFEPVASIYTELTSPQQSLSASHSASGAQALAPPQGVARSGMDLARGGSGDNSADVRRPAGLLDPPPGRRRNSPQDPMQLQPPAAVASTSRPLRQDMSLQAGSSFLATQRAKENAAKEAATKQAAAARQSATSKSPPPARPRPVLPPVRTHAPPRGAEIEMSPPFAAVREQLQSLEARDADTARHSTPDGAPHASSSAPFLGKPVAPLRAAQPNPADGPPASRRGNSASPTLSSGLFAHVGATGGPGAPRAPESEVELLGGKGSHSDHEEHGGPQETATDSGRDVLRDPPDGKPTANDEIVNAMRGEWGAYTNIKSSAVALFSGGEFAQSLILYLNIRDSSTEALEAQGFTTSTRNTLLDLLVAHMFFASLGLAATIFLLGIGGIRREPLQKKSKWVQAACKAGGLARNGELGWLCKAVNVSSMVFAFASAITAAAVASYRSGRIDLA